jgi:hypothetical protein
MAADSKPTKAAIAKVSTAPVLRPKVTPGSKPLLVIPSGPGSPRIAKSKTATTMISRVRKTARTLALRSTWSSPSSAITPSATKHHVYHAHSIERLSAAKAPIATPNRP